MAQQTLFPFTSPQKSERRVRRNLVIEAGAGTGKTTVIVAEALALLLSESPVPAERIVLVTFTEKAAGEIADRIHAALGDLELHLVTSPAGETVSWPPDSSHPLFIVTPAMRSQVLEAATKQLSQIDSLRAQTIHSFCQSLLRQFPIEAGLDPQFKIIEGFERSLLHGQLYDAWLDEETRTNPAAGVLREWEALLHHAGYLFLIRNMVLSLIERRDLLLDESYAPGGIELVEEKLLAALDNCSGIDDQICRYAHSEPRPARGSSIDAWIDYLEPIAADIRKTDLPRRKQHAAYAEALSFLRGSENKGSSIYDRLTAHRGAMALQSLTRRYLRFLEREKQKLGVVDFDDLLLRTVALLEDEKVLERIRRQFDYLFVDEFQDTDGTQARIIDRLARDRSGAWVPGKLVVVGDPKQSIYGFRRADPETYDRVTRALLDDPAYPAERRILADQYRSDPPLVEAVNAMFASLFPDRPRDPNVFRPPYHQLRAARTTMRRDADARVTFLLPAGSDREGRFEREAETIAAWIEKNRDRHDRDLQRFALLFRRLTKIEDYLDTFDRLGIDYVLPPMRLFLDRRAPVDLLAVLRAVAWPFDRGAAISAARTPYFALTDAEIVDGNLRWRRASSKTGDAGTTQRSSALPDEVARTGEAGEVWRRFENALEAYREASKHLTVSELIDLIVQSTSIEAVYDAAADGVRWRRYLDHLRDLAFRYDQKAGGSVRQFVDEITRRRSEPDEMEPSLIDESRNAVRILTVHAAKGLEFDSVILPDLEFSLKPPEMFAVDEPRAIVMRDGIETLSARYMHTPSGAQLREVGSDRESAEMRRLFYVAVTRARSEIIFVTNPDIAQKQGFMLCVRELFDLENLPQITGRSVRPSRVGSAILPVAFERVEALNEHERRRPRLRDAALEEELSAGPIVEWTGPAALSLSPAVSPGEGVEARGTASDRAAGVLMHRLLERWDFVSSPEPLLRNLINESAVSDDVAARVRKRISVVQQSPVFRRIAAAELISREMTLHLLEEGRVVEKRIDRLVRIDGRELVVDYKSGRPSPDRLESDRAQVLTYLRAIARMTGKPCTGLLWYIAADRDTAIEVIDPNIRGTSD